MSEKNDTTEPPPLTDEEMSKFATFQTLEGTFARLRWLEAELTQRTAERDEAQKDAQRYRWLHSKGCYWIEIQSQPHGDYIFRGQAWADLKYAGIDAAIDAVIALQKQGGAA
jgi:multidrug resistance efflux pump